MGGKARKQKMKSLFVILAGAAGVALGVKYHEEIKATWIGAWQALKNRLSLISDLLERGKSLLSPTEL